MRDAATQAQVEAADPEASTWLSANAGSGKTRVLTDRVARLLLNGVDPQRILCLTYTKAAASEMQNRLFRRLGGWAMLEEGALLAALAELGVAGPIPPDRLAQARRLFARALETPGGLRIQTIHSFCAGLLRRFPLEAGVSPGFTEMDDRAARLLRDEIVEDMADGRAPDAVAAVARFYTGEALGDLAQDMAAKRADLAVPLDRAGALALFGLPPGMDADSLIGSVLDTDVADLINAVSAVMRHGTTTDIDGAAALTAAVNAPRDLRVLETLEGVLLFKSGATPFAARIGKTPTKTTRMRLGPLGEGFENLMLRVEAARPLRLALQTAERTVALHAFAAVFLPEYAARKAARGWLDFDDLISRARALLTDPAVAQWVLFRLDGGIDHILVDEAQDTSPDQWRVIAALAQEFTAGQGARDVARTIFVVGDKKQSIYSFQGADLVTFERMKADFAARLEQAGSDLQDRALEHSFRSSPAILRLVDATFGGAAGLGGPVRHLAFHPDMPGRVDMWPVLPAGEKPDPGAWHEPLDQISEADPEVVLARRIAATIAAMIADGQQITVAGVARPITAGDVLILVQRRSTLFSQIIRACKAAGLPIAGADRLKLGAELAVKDLLALLSVLATPEDDLALASVLRSPLFGWSEDDLFRLAHGRSGYLWAALRTSEAHPETLAMLHDLRDRADFLRPYELIERALTRHDGRRRLLARLGEEAEDGIDALLSQALAYERSDVPGLTGFLAWATAQEVDVKRQMEQAGARIRVMTVHGAKGLEAPIVFLPETQDRRAPATARILTLASGQSIWTPPSDDMPDVAAEAIAEARDRAAAERLRLLYVAMTRAQSWLIVAAAGKTEKPDCWYNIIAEGMRAAGAVQRPDGGLHLAYGDWPQAQPGPVVAETVRPVLPDWARLAVADAARPAQAVSPSDLGGAKVMPGETAPEMEAAALRRGNWLHLLLQHLPQTPDADREAIGLALLARAQDAPDAGGAAALLAQARAILAEPGLASAFAPALSEVAVSGQVRGHPMLGSIDRLIVTPDAVTIIDYKSNRILPDRPEAVPEGILRQMGAYVALVAPLYPGRRVQACILWTEGPVLVHLPHDLVMAALQRAVFP